MLPYEQKQGPFVERTDRLFLPVSKGVDVGKRAKKMYGLRSAILHGGKRVISEEDAEWAERLASGCILRVLEHLDRWRNVAEFKAWLEGEDCSLPM